MVFDLADSQKSLDSLEDSIIKLQRLKSALPDDVFQQISNLRPKLEPNSLQEDCEKAAEDFLARFDKYSSVAFTTQLSRIAQAQQLMDQCYQHDLKLSQVAKEYQAMKPREKRKLSYDEDELEEQLEECEGHLYGADELMDASRRDLNRVQYTEP